MRKALLATLAGIGLAVSAYERDDLGAARIYFRDCDDTMQQLSNSDWAKLLPDGLATLNSALDSSET